MKLDEIAKEFKAKMELLEQNESAALPVIIDQGRLMVQFRIKARKDWETTCEKKLNISPRVARRYLKIGERWATQDQTPGPELLTKLPSDLHKLEALCDLSSDQLKTLSSQIDLRKVERTEMIAKVRAIIGKGSQQQSISDPVLSVFNKWDTFSFRLAKDVKQLNDHEKQNFIDEMEDNFQQLREKLEEALKAPAKIETQPDDDDDDGDEPEEENDTEEEKEKTQPAQPKLSREQEKPTQKTVPTKSARTGGKQ